MSLFFFHRQTIYIKSQFTDVPALSPGFTEDAAGKGNKIVAVIDSITANPGVLMPWKEMVRVAHEEGVWTVIDAAHSIGQEVRTCLKKIIYTRKEAKRGECAD